MELWNGGCHVHERFSVEAIAKLKAENPEAIVMAHLECKAPVLAMADVKGSTADMIRYAKHMRKENNVNRLSPPTFIVATEAGIMHELKRMCPDCTFIPVPPEISEGATSCGCNECQYMKLNTLQKLRDCLRNEVPEVTINEEIAKEAVKPINKMLKLS